MAFGWAGAAAGAQGAIRQQRQDASDLESQLAEREYRRQVILQQQAQNERLNKQMGMEQQRFDAEQAQRAQATSQANNARGVQQMVGELIRREGVTPQNRQQIVGTLMEAGRMPTQSDLDGPQQPTGDTQWVLGPDGQEVHRVPQPGDKRIPAPTAASTPQQDWVRRGDKIVPIPRGTAQAGDLPYDPVAARQNGADPTANAKGAEIAAEVKRIATALRSHKGLNRAFGVMDSWFPTIDQDTAEAEELTKSLQSLLTLDNVGLMKGVLSDSDMKILRAASTTLNPRMGETAAAAELDRIIQHTNPLAQPGGGGGTIRMRAPNGEEMDVSQDQVRHYQGLGATVIGR
jgi:hypothetical protein